jgi:hypothetical protein
MEDNDIYEEYNDSDSQSSEMIGKNVYLVLILKFLR